MSSTQLELEGSSQERPLQKQIQEALDQVFLTIVQSVIHDLTCDSKSGKCERIIRCGSLEALIEDQLKKVLDVEMMGAFQYDLCHFILMNFINIPTEDILEAHKLALWFRSEQPCFISDQLFAQIELSISHPLLSNSHQSDLELDHTIRRSGIKTVVLLFLSKILISMGKAQNHNFVLTKQVLDYYEKFCLNNTEDSTDHKRRWEQILSLCLSIGLASLEHVCDIQIERLNSILNSSEYKNQVNYFIFFFLH